MLGLGIFRELDNLEKRLDSWIPAEFEVQPEIESIDHLPYDQWLKLLFPSTYSKPFAKHHNEFWQYVSSIEPETKPPAYFLVLARGGGKDANAQGAITYLGAKEKRKFCLYVCATQDLANKAVQTIANMLEGRQIESYYPSLASRQLSKYGHSRGWKVDMLRCGNGFNVVGLGLDASVRGIRLDEFRPDLIVFSDVDSREDSPKTIKKKINTIKFDILPAGTNNTAVIFIQNLIHKAGIINQVVTNQVDFLLDRIVNGPIPAIEGLQIEKQEKLYKIVAGTPTWQGQDIAACEAIINEVGPTSFRIESQHEVDLIESSQYKGIDFTHCNPDEVPDLISVVCAVDPAVSGDGDCCALQIDGIAETGIIYRLYSWEQQSTPGNAVRHAIIKSVEYNADVIIFETDQGGSLWEESYNTVWELLCTLTDVREWIQTLPAGTDLQQVIDDKYPQRYDLEDVLEYGGIIDWDTVAPDFNDERAGSIGSKRHRGNLQYMQYEKGRFVHVRNETTPVLEKALHRFLDQKPFDLHDAAFWAQWELIEHTPGAV